MNSLGYDKPLYILPFDHRGSFQSKLFGWKGLLTAEQSAQISSAKHAIFDAAKVAVFAGVPKERVGILVDEQFGADILRDAVAEDFVTGCPAEISEQEEFDFEFGDGFAAHIEKFHPTFCKALVRYNPEGNQARNRRQTGRLKQLSDYLHNQSYCLLMFELLVPPMKAQLDEFGGSPLAFDRELRPRLMVEAIHELQNSGIEPDVWMVEGLAQREDAEAIVAAARREGRHKVSCIVLGRGEDDFMVHDWLSNAAAVPGFIGFAVGRSVFWDPIVSWRQNKMARETAIAEMARRFHELVNVFEKVALAV